VLELLCCGGGCCCSVGQVLYIVFCKLLPAVIMLSVLSVTLGLFCFVWVFFSLRSWSENPRVLWGALVRTMERFTNHTCLMLPLSPPQSCKELTLAVQWVTYVGRPRISQLRSALHLEQLHIEQQHGTWGDVATALTVAIAQLGRNGELPL